MFTTKLGVGVANRGAVERDEFEGEDTTIVVESS